MLLAQINVGKCTNKSKVAARASVTTFLVKLTDLFEPSPAEAWNFAQRTIDEQGRKRDISHFCHSGTSQLCLEPSHFDLESKLMNAHRNKHQNGNEVCDCAKLGGKLCLVNGNIGEKVFDDDGLHIGWKKSSKRRRMA